MKKADSNFKNEFKKGAFILFSILLVLLFPNSYVHAEWSDVTPPNVSSDWELFDVRFVSANEGWAVGQDSINGTGVLLHFLNGTWTSVTPPQISLDWQLEGVHFISSREGWAVGRDSSNKTGVALNFSNGTWTAFPVPRVSSDWELSAVDVPSSSQGWAVGNTSTTGVLLHLSNNVWTSVTPPTVSSFWGLLSINFISSSEAWAVGQDLSNLSGVLLHFLKGAWASDTPPSVSPDWGLQDVDFISSSEGWAVGHDFSNKAGALLHFLNGTWTSVLPPTVTSDWELRGVFLTSSTNGWAVGRASDGTHTRGVLLRLSVPKISVSPKDINYSDVAIGAFKERSVTIGNHGNANLVIGTITSPSPPFSLKTDNCSGETILPQSSCYLTYQFIPTSEGSFIDTSNIPSNDPSKGDVTVILNGSGIAGPSLFIDLLSPPDGERFTVCSFYDPPTFQWNPSETFKKTEIRFSSKADFSTTLVKAKAKAGTSELLISSSLWKKVLLLPGADGGTVYWKVVGTRTDGSLVESDVFSLIVEGPEPVLNFTITPTSKTTPPFPTLAWENNCNIKFKAWFGNDPDFTKSGIRTTSLSFKVKNPNDNGGQFTKELITSQWSTIRKVVNDVSGSLIYWYIESWDGLGSFAQTGVNSFVLAD